MHELKLLKDLQLIYSIAIFSLLIIDSCSCITSSTIPPLHSHKLQNVTSLEESETLNGGATSENPAPEDHLISDKSVPENFKMQMGTIEKLQNESGSHITQYIANLETLANNPVQNDGDLETANKFILPGFVIPASRTRRSPRYSTTLNIRPGRPINIRPGRPINIRPGRPINIRPGRPINIRPGRPINIRSVYRPNTDRVKYYPSYNRWKWGGWRG